jgi:hypothetical protein
MGPTWKVWPRVSRPEVIRGHRMGPKRGQTPAGLGWLALGTPDLRIGRALHTPSASCDRLFRGMAWAERIPKSLALVGVRVARPSGEPQR